MNPIELHSALFDKNTLAFNSDFVCEFSSQLKSMHGYLSSLWVPSCILTRDEFVERKAAMFNALNRYLRVQEKVLKKADYILHVLPVSEKYPTGNNPEWDLKNINIILYALVSFERAFIFSCDEYRKTLKDEYGTLRDFIESANSNPQGAYYHREGTTYY